MDGLGDNIHQRAAIRQLLGFYNPVYLRTPWPSVYHDLVASGLQLLQAEHLLRTQRKNQTREVVRYFRGHLPGNAQSHRIWYTRDGFRKHGSPLAAMLADSSLHVDRCDFSMPVRASWRDGVRPIAAQAKGRPIMVYRPLVVRHEWAWCAARNPDADAYHDLFAAIRDRYFVVSIADLEPDVEWIVSRPVKADLEFHHGELSFEMLAGLVSYAAMMFASPGFAIPLAQALRCPSVCVFGGYEPSDSFHVGRRLARHLAIAPIAPCPCLGEFKDHHVCPKAIDMPRALAKLEGFVDAASGSVRTQRAAG